MSKSGLAGPGGPPITRAAPIAVKENDGACNLLVGIDLATINLGLIEQIVRG
jgi:hypothetical protein